MSKDYFHTSEFRGPMHELTSLSEGVLPRKEPNSSAAMVHRKSMIIPAAPRDSTRRNRPSGLATKS
jgi:hypothetical protein